MRPVEYTPYLPIREMLPELRSRHEDRAEESPDFIYLMDQIARTREVREREEISLNELTVKTEREENRREEFEAENLRRMMKGLPLKEWQDEATEEDDETVVVNNDTQTSAGEEEATDELGEPDPLLLESGRVLADFISLTSPQLSRVDNLPIPNQ